MKPSDTTVLMELRPALDGFYGIPQETRLLFASLAARGGFQLRGLLQLSTRRVKGGVGQHENLPEAARVHRFARTVVSLKGDAAVDWKDFVGDAIANFMHKWGLRLRVLGLGRVLTLNHFETRYFQDFVWRQLFGHSVSPAEREVVLACDHLTCSTPWRWMHLAGIERAWLMRQSSYPKIDTAGMDVFIAQTPYPGRVARSTKLVVHYHDAIPVLMPHTISDRAFHEASHFHALAANVRDGAYFVCVSDATRRDLLMLFPQAEARAVTIHNMLSAHYFLADAEPERLGGIVRRHLLGEFRPKGKHSSGGPAVYKLVRSFGNEEEKTAFYARAFAPGVRYLFMVSTIEPRKNHIRLVEAWQVLRDRIDPDLKLVLVGHMGWDHKAVLDACMPGIEQGCLFLLQSVPAESLRLLYRHATVTVCPSVGEGFDFSGAEAMRCGGLVAASSIPVHHEVYGDAAAYFDPYDTASLVQVLNELVYTVGAQTRAEALRQAGQEQSARYLPERIVPKWDMFLRSLTQHQTVFDSGQNHSPIA